MKKSKPKPQRVPNQFQLQPGATGTRNTQKRYGLDDENGEAPLSERIVTNVELRRLGFWRPPELESACPCPEPIRNQRRYLA